jgi:uncharacterized protein YggL (DUF469 family)
MRKRLRKKRRFGEFQELEFPIAFRLKSSLRAVQVDEFIRELVAAAERRELVFLGSGDVEWYGAVTRSGRGSPTEEDQQFLHDLLAADARVEAVNVGPLRDAWNGEWENDSLPEFAEAQAQ